MGCLAMAVLLELLDEVTEPATEHAAGSAAREQAAERALDQIAEPSSRLGSGRRRRLRSGACLTRGHVLDGLPGEQTEDRHRHWRHSTAGLRIGTTGAAGALLHAVEYVE